MTMVPNDVDSTGEGIDQSTTVPLTVKNGIIVPITKVIDHEMISFNLI